MPTLEWASVGEPSVAIAMPVRDCEATIETAIRSILHQTYRQLDPLPDGGWVERRDTRSRGEAHGR